ncbi:MAG: butanol dehydrogenase [Sphingobacteriia bacterium]|nr:butanol dehydrogenase [Sphingobacteriia bacterium]NCC39395.1 butanol dehydrogenase [Gammaproteobacteria bacterium]
MPDSRSSKSRRLPIALALVFVAGIAFTALVNTGIAYTNRMELCVSCHSIQPAYEEYRQTMHFKNASGVQATCADCHVPQSFLPKLQAKLLAAKDVYHEFKGTIDTPEKFEAHRWTMANRVWDRMKATDSETCRSCHDFSNMDLSAQSRSARSRHGAAEDRGLTCIDCHKGIAHHLPDEPEAMQDMREDMERDAT